MFQLWHILRSLALAAVVFGHGQGFGPGLAQAQGRLDARYTVTLAGIPIGKGTWVIEISDTRYSAQATGETTGLMHAFTGGQGSTAARGVLQGGKPVSSVYAATIKTRKKTDEIRLSLDDGKVKETKLDPPLDDDKERVPLTEDVKRGVQDPMTATLVRVAGKGNPLSAEACQRTLAVFDGRLRYDLQLAFKRVDFVKADKGYAGPVVVCAIYFSPVAGFNPSRSAIRYMSRMRDMEVWLAPIAGTRLLVPFRVQGPTPIGMAVMEADEFVAAAAPVVETTKASVKEAVKESTKNPAAPSQAPTAKNTKTP